MIDLDELERLARAATPGPWEVRQGDSEKENLVANVRGLTVYGPYTAVACNAEAAYIAAVCPQNVLDLIAAVRELQVKSNSEGL